MDSLNFTAIFTFILVTTYTPGPNNITGATMGSLYGFKKTFPFCLGVISGILILMTLCGVISHTLLSIFPSFEAPLRIIGALYILWLAYKTYRANFAFDIEETKPLNYINRVLLQFLNPKAIIMGLAIFTSLLAPITDNIIYIILAALVIALLGLSSISVWTLFGSVIHKYLYQSKAQKIINLVFSLLLVYTAVEISGILELI